MRHHHEPTRLGRWVLRLRAGAERRRDVEDDLVELFRLRAAERGWWYAQWRWLVDAASVRRPAWRPPSGERRRPVVAGLWQDVRVAARALVAERRFTAIAMVILTLGIGVTTAVFSVVNAVLLRPLPYAEPDRLVAITGLLESATRRVEVRTIALSQLTKWRPLASSFESMGAFAYTELPVRVGDRAFSPVTALMDPEFLSVLGNPVDRGSIFPTTDVAGAERTVIVSHALWLEAFNGDPRVVGRTITVDGDPYEVRGVLAADFQFPRSDVSYFTKPVDLLMLAAAVPAFPDSFSQWWGIARLAPGVTLEHAQAELQAVAEGLTRTSTGEARSVRLVPLASETTQTAREPLLVVLWIAVVLLAIASTNLMNLFLARGVGRMREMSIRRAIGGTTWQLLRLLLIESLLLAVAGGTLGVWLASLAIRGIVSMSPVHLPVTHAIDIDGTVLGFALLLCVGTAVAAALLPALHVSAKTNEAVRSPGMRTTASRGVQRAQQALCVTQIALGMALLASSGLLARSLWQLDRVDPGFEAAGVLGFDLSVPGDVSRDDRTRFYSAALAELRTIPGVENAGFISFLPPELRAGVFMGIGLEGAPPPAPDDPPRQANTLITSTGYFDTMRMRIVRGRDFTEADTAGHPPVVVVNETFARRYFAGEDPLGRRVGTGFDGLKPVRAIVGVVADTHDRGAMKPPIPTVYLPLTQFSLGYGAIALRTAAPPGTIVPVIRDRIRRLDPAVPLTDFQKLDDRLYESLREPRFYTLMATGCAGMAVLFVMFGLYGLVSYSFGRRTTELGIRMAVGATRATIARMVLAQGLRMAFVGVALGLGLAVLSSRALRSQLFEVQPLDPLTFAGAALAIVTITVAASYAPARRASRVNPMTALRPD